MAMPGPNKGDGRLLFPGEVTSALTFRGCFIGIAATVGVGMLIVGGYLLYKWLYLY